MDRPRQAVLGDLSDVVVVEVEPEQPLEAAEEVVGELDDLVVAEEEGGEGVPEAEEVAVGEGRDLVATTKKVL